MNKKLQKGTTKIVLIQRDIKFVKGYKKHVMVKLIICCLMLCALHFQDQLRRYTEIKQSDLTAAQAAKLTREFRCPPQEQMRALLAFRKEDLENDDPTKIECPCSDELRAVLWNFHCELLKHCGHPGPQVSLFPCHQLELTILLYNLEYSLQMEHLILVSRNQMIIMVNLFSS